MSGVQTSVATVLAMDELLIEIIFRVPSIFLIRLQLVSKRWQSLIYSPFFRCLRRGRPSPPSFILPSLFTGEFFYCSPHHKLLLTFCFKSPSEILASHNGLMLLAMGKLRYRVYNLTTGKSRKLPHLPLSYLAYENVRFRLGYEPTKSPDYRIIRLSSDDGCIHIYESKSRKWTEIELIHSFPLADPARAYCNYLRASRSWVCCNDKVYWIPVKTFNRNLSLERRKLIKTSYWYFDLNTRKSGKFPSINADGKCDEHLFEWSGRVYGVIRCETDEKYFDVFLLSEDDSHWSKICRLDWSMWYKYTINIGLGLGVDLGWPVSIVMGEESTILIDLYKKIISFPLSGTGSKMIFDIPKNMCYTGFCKFMECFDNI